MTKHILSNQNLQLGSQVLTDALSEYADILVRTKDVTLFHMKENRKVIQVQGTLTGWNIWDVSHGGEIHVIDDVSDSKLIEIFCDLSQ